MSDKKISIWDLLRKHDAKGAKDIYIPYQSRSMGRL